MPYPVPHVIRTVVQHRMCELSADPQNQHALIIIESALRHICVELIKELHAFIHLVLATLQTTNVPEALRS
ncbi:unnamed protein product [Bursaphelenchus xylophilus]|uniref:(pine wood nematode) hypothetical protein n=1 Tax=Bursaphelenchus xylophilus TaxID=6326 RepID=A0A1I7SAP6_BURXY|nr:unnamed protein product [Bursaphelenchus xylophilus]CAG9126914.1 unnamed protein product [Bursaphelenchus xylophilus]